MAELLDNYLAKPCSLEMDLNMKVGVLGSGIVGQTLAAGFLMHGHQVLVGTRDPRAKDFLKWAGKNRSAKTGTFAEAAQFGEVLVLAVLARVIEDVINLAGFQNFRGSSIQTTHLPTHRRLTAFFNISRSRIIRWRKGFSSCSQKQRS